MSPTEVIEIEGTDIFSQGPGELTYIRELLGERVRLTYRFVNDRLRSAVYRFWDTIIWNRLTEGLKAKYGEPTKEDPDMIMWIASPTFVYAQNDVKSVFLFYGDHDAIEAEMQARRQSDADEL